MKSRLLLLLAALFACLTLRAADQGLQFGGNGGSVILNTMPAMGIDNVATIEFWAYIDEVGQRSVFTALTADEHIRCLFHPAWTDGRTYWDFGNIHNGGRLSMPTPAGLIGRWAHFALVSSPTTKQIYIDGVLAASSPTDTPFDWTTPSGANPYFLIGAFGSTGRFKGRVDEFRIWSVVRTAAEINRFRGLRLTGHELGLRVYLTLDDVSGLTVPNHAYAAGGGTSFQRAFTDGSSVLIVPGVGTDRVVTTTLDSGPGSLRQAMADAAATATPDYVTFAPALSGQSIPVASELVVSEGSGLNIDATALAGGLTLAGTGSSRLLRVGSNGSASLRSVMLTGGTGGSSVMNGHGGAILNQGLLRLHRTTVYGNTTSSAGGGLRTTNWLIMTQSTIAGNNAGTQGGGLYAEGKTELSHVTIGRNSAGSRGGGLVNRSELWLDAGCFGSNTAPLVPEVENASPGHIFRWGVRSAVPADPGGTQTGNTAWIVTDPLLSELSNYGGGTLTLLPSATAPFNTLGAVAPYHTIDQRGLDSGGGGYPGACLRNRPPAFTGLIAATGINEDTSTSDAFTVADADTGGASVTLSVTATSNSALLPLSAVTLSGTGGSRSITLTPLPNQFGTVTVTLAASDGQDTTTRDVTLTVNPVEDPATATNLSVPETYTEDTPLNLADIVITDVDNVAAITLTLSPVDAGQLSTATAGSTTSTFTAATGQWQASGPVTELNALLAALVFTPKADASNTVTLTTAVTGGPSGSKTMTGVAVNDPPTLNAIADRSLAEDSPQQTISLGGISAGAGETGAISVTATSSNPALIPHPAITHTSPNNTGSLRFTPIAQVSGTATITVTVSDGTLTFSRTFTVTVTPVNDPPTLDALSAVALNEDADQQTVSLTGLTAGPGESQSLTVTASSNNPALIPHPTVTYTSPNPAGTVTFTPVPNASGTATITVTVSDGTLTFSRTFTVTVTAVNDIPTITSIAGRTINRNVTSSPIPFTLGDVETAVTSLTVSGSSTNQAVLANTGFTFAGTGASRTVTLTPVPNASGQTTVTLTVSDGGGDTASSSFLVTVSATNSLPTITAVPAPTFAEDSTSGELPFTLGDFETSVAALTVTATSTDHTLIAPAGITFLGGNADRRVLLRSEPHRSGTATVTLTVSDGLGSTSTSFLVTVTAVNDPPAFDVFPAFTLAPGGQIIPLTGINAGPFESQPLTMTVVSSNPSAVPAPAIGYTSPAATGTLGFAPATGSGAALITLTLSDGNLEFTHSFFVLSPANPLSHITNTADSGPGSLRAAMDAAPPGAGDLLIDPTLSGLTIDLLSEITVPPGSAVTLDASALPAGLTLRAAPTTSTRHFTVPVTAGLTLRACTLLGGAGEGADAGGFAGAILNRGQLDLSRCTFSGGQGEASAVYNFGTATFDRCTLTSGEGQAVIFSEPASTTTLTHCTISQNQSGFFTLLNLGHLRLGFNLIAGNTLGNESDIGHEGTLTRLGPNLIGTSSDPASFPPGLPNAHGDFIGSSELPLSPHLAPLGNYGGPTPTMRLLPGSPALNRLATPAIASDQRGFPLVGPADLGAYENGAPTLTTIADHVILADSIAGPHTLTTGDAETAAGSLTVTGTSSNTTLIPVANIIPGGSGAARTVTITPAPGQTGNATITLTVSDGANTTSASFLITVLPNTPYHAWTLTTFPSAATPAERDATADYDHDGQTNGDEWNYLTDPASGGSFFAPSMTSSGADLLISFPSIPGRTYRLEAATTLAPEAWTDAALPAISGDGTVKAFTIPAAGARSFFRVVTP